MIIDIIASNLKGRISAISVYVIVYSNNNYYSILESQHRRKMALSFII